MNSPDSLRGGDDDTYERRKLGKGRVSRTRLYRRMAYCVRKPKKSASRKMTAGFSLSQCSAVVNMMTNARSMRNGGGDGK